MIRETLFLRKSCLSYKGKRSSFSDRFMLGSKWM